MKNIATEWEDYRKAVVPADASDAQVHDTHMAFLAGAKSLQTLLETHSDDEGIEILRHFEGQIKAAIAANRILALGTEPPK